MAFSGRPRTIDVDVATLIYTSATTGAALTQQDVLRFCKENMTARMLPRAVQIVESLPRTGHGKVDRKQLQAHPSP